MHAEASAAGDKLAATHPGVCDEILFQPTGKPGDTVLAIDIFLLRLCILRDG